MQFIKLLQYEIHRYYHSTIPLGRGVYSQEFVANGVEKSWSRSYGIIFLVILHIQIKEFNYRLLIMLK